MSTIVYRISVLLSAILAAVPVGTNLGLFWLLWALISGRFLLSRGAVFPALADGGLPADAVRRSGAVLAYGRWAIETLVQAWHQVVLQEDRWHAHSYEGFRPVACDLVGVTVQVVKTSITPQLATSERVRAAKTEPLHPAGRLHMRRR